jgi:uncharacterized membrane protein (UPF0127 family)
VRFLATMLFSLALTGPLAACGENEGMGTGAAEFGPQTSTESEPSRPTFSSGQAEITGPRGRVVLSVEIAETDEQRQFGLMFRESLPRNAGMAFVFPDEVSGGFWMKNTLIPLSIAFYDKGGRILEILDMDPCRADPCRTYDPGVAYRGALEVNQGAFDEWGVRVGDRIRLHR